MKELNESALSFREEQLIVKFRAMNETMKIAFERLATAMVDTQSMQS